MSTPPRWQDGRLGRLLGIHGPPEISEDIKNMSLIRRHQRIETPTEVEWFETSKKNKLRRVRKHQISKPYDLRMSMPFELAAYLKRRLDPTRTVPEPVHFSKWRNSKMNIFNFSPTKHLHRMLENRKIHYDHRRGPLVKSPRPHHPLANELRLEHNEEIVYSYIPRESMDSYVNWLEVYLPTDGCPLRHQEVHCQNCNQQYQTNELFLGFQTQGRLCNECSKQHILKLHQSIEQNDQKEEVKDKRWNWLRKSLNSSGDDEDGEKGDGKRKWRKKENKPPTNKKNATTEKEKRFPPARPEYLKPCPL